MENISFAPLYDYEIDEETRAALAELGLVYLSELPVILQDLRALLADSVTDRTAAIGARNIAHKMRGTAGSMGFPELSEMAGQLEDKLSYLEADAAAGSEAWWCEHLLEVNETVEKLSRLATFLLTGESLGGNAIKLVFLGGGKVLLRQLETIFSGSVQLGPGNRTVRMQAACNETELLALMPGFPADVFLVDARLGFERLSALKSILNALRINPPVLVVIAESSAATRQTLFTLGATDFVCAPLCKDEVLARLAAVVKN